MTDKLHIGLQNSISYQPVTIHCSKRFMKPYSIYNIPIIDSNRKELKFIEYRNKVVVIVNVATLCGFTVQYEALEELYKKYKDQGLVILGFPCNQFGNQEPYSIEQTVAYVKKKFGVTFPIMDKVEVNGEREAPLYKFLKEAKRTKLGFKGVRWNFEKFLIDRSGHVVMRFDTTELPQSIEPYIQHLLAQSPTN